MAGSIFGKLRKNAKEAAKVNRGQMNNYDAELVHKPIETESSTPEEIAALVNSLADAPTSPTMKEIQMDETIVIPRNTDFQAMGVYYDDKLKKYMKALINYNPITGTAELISAGEFTDNSAVAIVKVGQFYSLKLMRREEVV